MKTVKVGDISIGEGHPLALIAGPCVIESEDIVMKTAEMSRTLPTVWACRSFLNRRI